MISGTYRVRRLSSIVRRIDMIHIFFKVGACSHLLHSGQSLLKCSQLFVMLWSALYRRVVRSARAATQETRTHQVAVPLEHRGYHKREQICGRRRLRDLAVHGPLLAWHLQWEGGVTSAASSGAGQGHSPERNPRKSTPRASKATSSGTYARNGLLARRSGRRPDLHQYQTERFVDRVVAPKMVPNRRAHATVAGRDCYCCPILAR